MKSIKTTKNIIISKLPSIPKVINIATPEKINYYFVYISDKSLDSRITVNIKTEKSKVFLRGILCLFGSAYCNLDIKINHIVGNNKARVVIKTVLKDSANFNFTGLINILKKAHKSDSYLKQDNLLVSKNAICNSSPQLSIKADDVKASHGSTVGGFNKDELFYLQTRGLPKQKCKKLLEESFLLKTFGKNADIVLKELNLNSLASL